MYFVSLDDTDYVDTPGTGKLARALAHSLAAEYRIFGVTRHQLLVHPDVPYTKNNSANVVIVRNEEVNVMRLAEQVTAFMLPRCAFGGDPCGIIGAFAGACLAGTGNDGRFVEIGRVRELTGSVSVDMVLAAGISRIQTEDGEPVRQGVIKTGDKVRPALRDGSAVLFVRPSGTDVWDALKL